MQVGQVQSAHAQLLQASEQCAHWQALWLQVGHVQSAQTHIAHESAQLPHEHAVHSS